MTHGSVGRFDNKGLLLAFPAQLFDVVLELCVLSREDPGFGYEAVLLRLALDHSRDTRTGVCGNKVIVFLSQNPHFLLLKSSDVLYL